MGSRPETVALRLQWLHVVGVEGILSFTGAFSEGVSSQPRIARLARQVALLWVSEP